MFSLKKIFIFLMVLMVLMDPKNHFKNRLLLKINFEIKYIKITDFSKQKNSFIPPLLLLLVVFVFCWSPDLFLGGVYCSELGIDERTDSGPDSERYVFVDGMARPLHSQRLFFVFVATPGSVRQTSSVGRTVVCQ